MKLTIVAKITGVAWLHASADPVVLAQQEHELAKLASPEALETFRARWGADPNDPWGIAAVKSRQLVAARLVAIIAACKAAQAEKEAEMAMEAARTSNSSM